MWIIRDKRGSTQRKQILSQTFYKLDFIATGLRKYIEAKVYTNNKTNINKSLSRNKQCYINSWPHGKKIAASPCFASYAILSATSQARNSWSISRQSVLYRYPTRLCTLVSPQNVPPGLVPFVYLHSFLLRSRTICEQILCPRKYSLFYWCNSHASWGPLMAADRLVRRTPYPLNPDFQ